MQQKEGSKPKWGQRWSPGCPGGYPAGQERGHAREGPGPPGAPRRLHLGLEFSIFAKTLKNKLLLTFAMFPYRNTYLFLFCSCRCLKPGCNMFFMSCCVYGIYIHIDRISCHVMFESLSIHNLRFGAFKIINLDCTGAIYFFDMKRSFPSGK